MTMRNVIASPKGVAIHIIKGIAIHGLFRFARNDVFLTPKKILNFLSKILDNIQNVVYILHKDKRKCTPLVPRKLKKRA